MILRVRPTYLGRFWQSVRRISSVKRWGGKKLKQQTENPFKDTLNLPKTEFPLTMKGGAPSARERDIQKICRFQELYSWQQQQKDRAKTFTLHDGPPYANGEPHVGHALNKILKDITNRYKVLQGYRVEYTPGWDCHGMPIEQKALADIKADHTQLEPLDIRARAKKFAKRTIRQQSQAFQRWGVMADWQESCYYTFDKQYEADQLEVFYQMFDKELIYQDYMPVFWSPSSRTALAEAELEYNEKHVSTAVYVKFALTHLPNELQHQLGCNAKPHAVTWTTTAWTLPANQAICYGKGITYCLAQCHKSGETYIVAADFKEKLSCILGDPVDVLFTFEGHQLKGSTYSHPLRANEQLPMLPANHVTVEKGTGLVHTAPAHGPEDFQVATAYGLPMNCHVNEEGKYLDGFGPELAGKSVLSDGNSTVLKLMEANILHQEDFTHSYPYDWRTQQPVILRASKQWFVNTSRIRDRALSCLDDVAVIPKASGQGMLSQLRLRTYWCISRQRAWGVPIPVFLHKESQRVLLNRTTIDHIKSLVREHGTDCWWTLPTEQLLPEHILQQNGFQSASQFERGRDVLDIWFDSGSTWAAVLKGPDQVADTYMEGLDQFGGWFQSSLLTSVAVQDKAPYRCLVVHGLAMDEEGRKMSKSVGNVVSPQTVIDGGSDLGLEPAYGVDVLRWWAAQCGLDAKVFIGPTVLNKCLDQLFRVRKLLRYLLANLGDFVPSQHAVLYSDLLLQDQYMLYLLNDYLSQVTDAYEHFNYSKVLTLTERFMNLQVSGFYCHITKDRMYCSGADSPDRRRAQTVQHHILETVTKCLAPVLPHTAEEVYQYMPFQDSVDSLFKTRWVPTSQQWERPDLKEPFELALGIRDTFYSTIATENPVDFDVVICTRAAIFDIVKQLQDEELTSSHSSLAEVLQCSTVSVLSRPPLVIPDEAQPVEGRCTVTMPDGSMRDHKYLLVVLPAEDFQCKRCRRNTAKRKDVLCERCSEVVYPQQRVERS